jgi:hypothetical protein
LLELKLKANYDPELLLPKSQYRAARYQAACGKVLRSRLLPANSLNHPPKNFIREVFFFFSWIFSSVGGVLFSCSDLRRSTLEGQSPDALDSFYFTFCLRASDRSGLNRELRRIHLAMLFGLC